MALRREWRVTIFTAVAIVLLAVGTLCVSARPQDVATVAPAPGVPKFRVIAIAEHGGIHKPFVDAAKVWLNKLAKEKNFSIDYCKV